MAKKSSIVRKGAGVGVPTGSNVEAVTGAKRKWGEVATEESSLSSSLA